jgi:hypothetical protein
MVDPEHSARTRRVLGGTLLTAALVGAACDDSEPTAAPADAQVQDERDAWSRFTDAREPNLAALGEPILDCVQRKDTEHAAFHGCYDWHSAVHGVWALYALARLEGDKRWREAANAQLSYQAIDAVRAEIESGRLDQELPYGFSWFLLLVVERERATGSNDMRAVAAIAASKLRAYIEGLDADRRGEGLRNDDYKNLSWALVNLWRYAQHTGDADIQAWAEQFAREHLLADDGQCSLRQESYDADDFFSPCLLRVHAIAEMLSIAEATPWIEKFVGRDAQLQPLTEIGTPHPGGLNFSRAWGLWALWRLTADPQWRDAYVNHVLTHVAQPQYWREDYRSFSHWVPQFGIYAIALSYDQP